MANAYVESDHDLGEQIRILKKAFPQLGGANLDLVAALDGDRVESCPAFAGWCAVPDWRSVADTYSGAVSRMVEAIGADSGLPKPSRLIEHPTKSAYVDRLRHQQKSDVLTYAVQSGHHRLGQSAKEIRKCVDEGYGDEFPLGAFEIAAYLLTHPARLDGYCSYGILCPGDFIPADERCAHELVPAFRRNLTRTELVTRSNFSAENIIGGATGYVPYVR